MDFDLRAHTHLLTVAGSRAYGVHTEASDVDVKGVAIPPAVYYHGISKTFEQADDADPIQVFMGDMSDEEQAISARVKLEGSVYELRKFIRLAASANPNIMDVLFCRDEEVRVLTPLGAKLREHRNLFLSARARYTFAGYAASQLKRIKLHRRWLLHPPRAAPLRSDFGLPEKTLIPKDQLAAANAAVRKRTDSWEVDFGALEPAEVLRIQASIEGALTEILATTDDRWKCAARGIGLSENLIYVMQKEREYTAARREWQAYQGWKKHRNRARAELEAKYSFDVKHGAHLYRLQKMCREIIETGEVRVWRGGYDAEEILAIRQGEWSYERLVAWSEAEEATLTERMKSGPVAVPRVPDMEAIDALCQSLVETALRG